MDKELFDILKKLYIKKISDRFCEEEISKDIICELSFEDFRVLGLVDRNVIINLRTE